MQLAKGLQGDVKTTFKALYTISSPRIPQENKKSNRRFTDNRGQSGTLAEKGSTLFPSVTLDPNFSRLPAILVVDAIKGLATRFVKMANKPKSNPVLME